MYLNGEKAKQYGAEILHQYEYEMEVAAAMKTGITATMTAHQYTTDCGVTVLFHWTDVFVFVLLTGPDWKDAFFRSREAEATDIAHMIEYNLWWYGVVDSIRTVSL